MANVIMPKMGDAMEEGTLLRWLKQVGDEVEVGDPIAEIETDKVSLEIEASEGGVFTQDAGRRGAVGADRHPDRHHRRRGRDCRGGATARRGPGRDPGRAARRGGGPCSGDPAGRRAAIRRATRARSNHDRTAAIRHERRRRRHRRLPRAGRAVARFPDRQAPRGRARDRPERDRRVRSGRADRQGRHHAVRDRRQAGSGRGPAGPASRRARRGPATGRLRPQPALRAASRGR